MGELRWILIGIGVVALVAIYGFSRLRMRQAATSASSDRQRVEPGLSGTPSPDEPEAVDQEPVIAATPPAPEVPKKVVAIRLMSKDKAGFPGDKLVLAMRGAGLRHGRFGIFHCLQDDTDLAIFSVANLVEPGSFNLAALSDTRLPGVSMFLVLPGPEDALESLDRMIDTARSLAASLDGELLDEQGSSLSVQRERYIRDEIQQFIREHLTPASATGSEE